MLSRRVISTFSLSVVFWLMAAWAVARRENAKTRVEYADAGLVAALLLVALGFLLLKIGTKTGNSHEATLDAIRFALIMLVTGITCGLIALGFRL